MNTTESIIGGLELIFYALVFFCALHALMLAYHWFTYGNSVRVSTTALILYSLGNAVFLSILWVSIQII